MIFKNKGRGVFQTFHTAFCILPSACLISGCTVGPDYHAPEPAMPPAYINPSAPPSTQTSTTTQRPTDIGRWWRIFSDAELDSLVDRAIDANLDVRQAEARLRQSRAQRGVAAAPLLPDVNASGSYTRSGAGNKGHGASYRSSLFQAGFDATWELDVFGATRRNIEATDASIQYAIEDRHDVLITVASEVATDYINLRGYQEQLRIAIKSLADQQHTADLTRQKFHAGFVSKLDVSNADAQVYSTQSDIPAFQISVTQTIYALSILLGQEPAALVPELTEPQPIPLTPPDVPIGLPGDLLRRRPDIRRAEASLHSATAQIGVATAQLYPQFSLLGSLNIEAVNPRGLTNWANNVWGIGPSVTWPIFAGGSIVAEIQVQNALQQQAVLGYRQAVLTALSDVENALIAYSQEQQRRAALVASVNSNQDAFNISTQLYKQGQTDFLNVLNAERSLFAAQNALAISNANIATDLASLYKALGGGWETVPERGNTVATQPAAVEHASVAP